MAEFRLNPGYTALLDPRMSSDTTARLTRALESIDMTGTGVWVSSSGTSLKNADCYKLIALSEEALYASAEAVNEHLAVSAADRWITCLPDFHVGGLGIHIRAKRAGIEVVRAAGNKQRWDAAQFHQATLESNATLSSCVPTQLADLVQMKLRAPPSLRAVVIGGAALNLELYLAARTLGWPVLPSYGCTECASQVATATLQSLDFPTTSLPQLILLPHVEARINSELLELKSSALFSAEVLIDGGIPRLSRRSAGSWFRTSDRAELSGHTLKVLGREQDFLKIGGEGVNLQELRALLARVRGQLDGPGEIEIWHQPDARLGNKIVLVATDPKLGAKAAELFNAEVLPSARIRDVVIQKEIRRSALGKPLLRDNG